MQSTPNLFVSFVVQTFNMRKFFTRILQVLILFLLANFSQALAQNGHYLEISVDNFEGDSIYLGYYMGKSQYLVDTAGRTDGNTFVFEGDSLLPPGMYLVVFPPENSFFQLVLDATDQHHALEVNAKDPASSLKCESCTDNNLLYAYTQFLKGQKDLADSIKAIKENPETDSLTRMDLEKELEKLDEVVRSEQERIVAEHENAVTSAIIKAGWEPEIPEFDENDEDVGLKRYRYYKKHYFDHMDLGNPALTRTPMFFRKITYYVDKLTVQHPDSINTSLDLILDGLASNKDAFQYYLVHYLNTYAKSKMVGMDAVYVHLVDRFYKTGMATWTDPDQLQKIIKNSDAIKPTLIGELAPPISLEDREGNKVDVMASDKTYTILYFWRPDCGHCKKSTPHLIKFLEEYEGDDVQIYAICMKFTKEVQTCWDYIDDNENMQILEHLVDPYHRSKFATLYNIKSTPQIFILDEDKRILTKKIATEKLGEVLDTLKKWEAEQEVKENEMGSK